MSFQNSNSVHPPVEGVGLSFKPDFFEAINDLSTPDIWFEVHTENYCAVGGPRKQLLTQLSERFPVSFHGVGGSLGNQSHDLTHHLTLVGNLVKQVNPALVSEHVAWSVREQEYFADLLPIRRTEAAITTLVDNIDRYQSAIGRPILIENPTHYVDLSHDVAEPEFLEEVAKRSGCGLLLDITNLYLSEVNCGVGASQFIDQIPAHLVGEIHVAGFERDPGLQGRLIDSHSQPVPSCVKELLGEAYKKWGSKPTLLERDANLPAFSDLLRESEQLQCIMQEHNQDVA